MWVGGEGSGWLDLEEVITAGAGVVEEIIGEVIEIGKTVSHSHFIVVVIGTN